MRLAPFTLAALLALGPGCGGEADAPGGTLSVRLHTPSGQGLGAMGASTVLIRVSGSDLATPRVLSFPVSAGRGSVDGIPYGNERVVTVEALGGDAGDELVARGASVPISIDAPRGTSADVLVAPVEAFSAATAYGEPTVPAELTAGRVGHSVTPLLDGRVLIAGGAQLNDVGNEVDRFYDTLEIYDPKTGTMSIVPTRLNPGRAFHTATRLRGTKGYVLISGGLTFANGRLVSIKIGDIFLPQGVCNPNDDPSQLCPTHDLLQSRARHAATLRHDGTVLLTGGIAISDGAPSEFEVIGDRTAVVESAELFTPRPRGLEGEQCTGDVWAFCQQGRLETPRADHASVRIRNLVQIIGGRGRSGVIRATEFFRLSDNEPVGDFLVGPELATGRVGAAVVRKQDETILVIGGEADPTSDGTRVFLNSIEAFDPDRQPPGFASLGASTGVGRRDPAAVVLDDDSVLVAGGIGPGNAPLSDARVFEPTNEGVDEGRPVGSLRTARGGARAVVMANGSVLLAGGRSASEGGAPSFTKALEIYTP